MISKDTPLMHKRYFAIFCSVLICFLGSCSYAPNKSVGTYNYSGRQMAIGVTNPPKDAMVITSVESETPFQETPLEKPPIPRTSEASSKPEALAVVSADKNPSGFWLSTSSNKRHTSSCRYFKNSNGRFCEANEGIPCKICLPNEVTSIPSPPAYASASEGYWLSNSSHKRHNSSCRYYKASSGSPCSQSDGTPCKICGG